jgi:hypothetical protein
MNVFVIKGIARDVPLETIFRGVMPFIVAQIVLILILIAFPRDRAVAALHNVAVSGLRSRFRSPDSKPAYAYGHPYRNPSASRTRGWRKRICAIYPDPPDNK